MFSVTPEITPNKSLRGEPPRHSAPDNSPQGGDFASLIDSNAFAATRNDRAAPSNSSDAAARRDDTSGPQDAPQRDGNASNVNPSQDSPPSSIDPRRSGDGAGQGAVGKSNKHAKTTAATAPESGGKDNAPTTDTSKTADAAVTASEILPDATAIIAVAVATAPTAPATATPTATSTTASGPLTIAAAAIAVSANDVADSSQPITTPTANAAPTASTGDAVPMAEAVAAAANEIATTNLKIAKAVETAPTPATKTAADASVNLQAQQQLGAAVVTPDAGLIKATQKASTTDHRDETAATMAKALKSDDAASTSLPSPQPNADNTKTSSAATTPDTQAGDGAKSLKPDNVATSDASAAKAGAATAEHRAANLNTPTASLADATSQASNTVAQPQFVPTATTAVPAAQLSAAVATGIAVPLNGLAIQIAANAQSGRSRFDIRLDPAELGRIDVRLDVDRHGQVTSHLVVEKPETLAMLRQDALQLQRALEDAGLKTGNNGLQFSLRDQSSGNGGDNHSGRHAQRLIIGDADTLPVVTAGKSYGQSTGSSRGLDIRV